MKDTVNERFKIFFESLKIKNEKFADHINATPKDTSIFAKTKCTYFKNEMYKNKESQLMES